jgi:hypothetical protein
MRILKHFVWVAKGLAIRMFCKHESQRIGSCPVTELTYTTCNDCGKRMSIVRTETPNV